VSGIHRRVSSGAAIASVLAVTSCALFFDESEFTGKRVASEDGGEPSPGSESGAQDAPATDPDGGACPNEGVPSTECLARAIPTDGLILWLRADDGVETAADGRVTAWRDATKKLRPGSSGYDALLADGGTPPVKADGAVVFSAGTDLTLPAGFADFSAGISTFAAIWPEFDSSGGAGVLLALGWPPQQDDCSRLPELGIGGSTGYGFDYRAETEAVAVDGVLDGRGWDAISVVQGGWADPSACSRSSVKLRHGLETVSEGTLKGYTKAVRSGAKVGRSVYFPQAAYSGKLGELLLYDRALSDADALRVAKYLSDRWPRR
jgi:hypothetical protein